MGEVGVTLTLEELEETFGVLFIGYVVSMVAYGFTFFQTYMYFSRYPMDNWVIKFTVAILCLLDTTSSALISHAVYHYLVVLFPLTTGLVRATPTYSTEFGLSIISVFIVQMFYSHRIWSASKSAYFSASAAVVSTLAFAMGLVTTAKLAIDPAFTSFGRPENKAIMALTQGSVFVSAVIATSVLYFYLNPAHHPTIRRLNGWYEILVTYIISRGTLAVAIQLCFFISFVVMPTNAYWMPFHLLASKMFINSLLAMLNDRDIYNGQGLNEEDIRSKSRGSTSFPNTERNTNNSVRFGGVLDDKSPSAIEIAVPQSISTEEQGNETHALSSKIDDDFEESHDWHRKGVSEEGSN